MPVSHLHEKDGTASDDDATALSLSYDSDKHIFDVSPIASEFPEIPKTTIPIAEHWHNKPSPRRREETLDPRRFPTPPKRTLVLCFDGTGDQFDADNSNIVQLVSLLKKDDSTKQLVYYQAGIGMTAPSMKWLHGASMLMLLILREIRFAYLEVPILHEVLRECSAKSVYFLQAISNRFHSHTRADTCGRDQSQEFKSAFSVDVPITFIGIWDTVSSLGAIRGKSLPVTTASTNARIFRHALSLDERRARFQARFWKDKQIDHPSHYDAANHYIETDVEEFWFAGCHCDVGGGSVSNKTRHSLARISLRWMIREYFKTNTGIMFNFHSLAKIGLDPSTLHPVVTPRPAALPVEPSDRIRDPPATPIPINIRALSIMKKKQPDLLKDLRCEKALGTEEQEELRDALSPKYDQLSIMKVWWILEILPFVHIRQHNQGHWVRHFMPHLGRPRHIPHRNSNGLKVHRSVSLRMQAEFENERARKKCKKYTPKYTPEARFDVDPTWID